MVQGAAHAPLREAGDAGVLPDDRAAGATSKGGVRCAALDWNEQQQMLRRETFR